MTVEGQSGLLREVWRQTAQIIYLLGFYWVGRNGRGASVLFAIALLCPPAIAQPGQISKLDAPGDDVGGYAELVIENCGLIHLRFLVFASFFGDGSRPVCGSADQVAFERFLGLGCGNALLAALHHEADGKQQDAPGEPGKDIPNKGDKHRPGHA